MSEGPCWMFMKAQCPNAGIGQPAPLVKAHYVRMFEARHLMCMLRGKELNGQCIEHAFSRRWVYLQGEFVSGWEGASVAGTRATYHEVRTDHQPLTRLVLSF